jgi:hypothetical protein
MVGIASKQSLNPDNKTATKARIGIRNAGPSATTLCNAYKKALEDNPLLTFSAFKKEYMKGYWAAKRDRKQSRKHIKSSLGYARVGLGNR